MSAQPHPLRLAPVLILLAQCSAATAQEASQATAVDFGRDIMPILAKNCVACHNAKKTEGGLDLESHTALLAGGDSGDSVVAGKPEESYLIARVSGAEEPLMPPEDNAVGAQRLSEKQIGLLSQWISLGAPTSKMQPKNEAIRWQALPENLKPIYALDSSPDRNYVAFGRGSTVTVVSQPISDASSHEQRLIDPVLRHDDGSPTGNAHLDIVQSVAFSPNSQRLATGGYRTVKIWRKQTEANQLLAGLSPPGDAIALSSDGKRVAFATGETGLELVDIGLGQAHRFLKAHSAAMTAAIWLSDNNTLLSCDLSGQMVLTDSVNHQTTTCSLDKPVVVQSIVRLASDRLFAVRDDGQVIEILLGSLDSHGDRSVAVRDVEGLQNIVALSATGDETPILVAAGGNGTVRIVNPESGDTVSEFKTEDSIRRISVSRDGSLVATLHEDTGPKLWRIQDGELIATLDQDYFHSQQLAIAQRNVTRQQAMIDLLAGQVPGLQKAAEKEAEAQKKVQEARDKAATALADQMKGLEAAGVAVTEAEKALSDAQAALAQAMKQVESMTANLETKKKAVAESEGKRKSAEAELAKRDQALAAATDSANRAAAEVPKLESRIAEEKELLSKLQANSTSLSDGARVAGAVAVAFSGDGSHAIVAGQDHVVRTYKVASGSPAANLVGSPTPVRSFTTTHSGHVVAFTAGGQVLQWDLSLPWKLERTIGSVDQSPLSDRVTALDFSPDGQWLAVGSGPPSRFGDVKLLSVLDGTLVKDLGEAHSDTVLGVRFSPDGRQLATAGADKLCRLFDVDSGKMLRAFEGHTHHVLGVAWKDNGQTLATAGADGSVKLWKAATGESLRTIGGFSKEVTALEFLEQTSQLATASADGQVRLHNADDGKQIRSFGGAKNALYSVTISAGGKSISAGGQAGVVWTWQSEDAKLVGTLPQSQ